MKKGPVLLVSSVLLGLILAVLFLYLGWYDVAATTNHSAPERWLFSTVKRASIRARADTVQISVPSDSASLARGYASYRQMCVNCHGAPGHKRGWIGQGLNPEPTDLSEVVSRYDDRELYWVLANGIRLAGMPGLAATHSQTEIAEIAAFVRRLPGMTAAQYQAFDRANAPAGSPTPVPPGHEGHSHTH